MEKFKVDLRKMILNLPFLIYKIVYKVCKTVLSGITKTRGIKQSGLFCFLEEVGGENKKVRKKIQEEDKFEKVKI